jgi:hypothetical protein
MQVEIRDISPPKQEEDPDQMAAPSLEDYVFSMEERDQMAYEQWVKRYQDESVIDAEMVRVAYGDRPLGDLSATSIKRSIDVDFPLEAAVASVESEKRKRTTVKAKKKLRSRPSTADGTRKSHSTFNVGQSTSKRPALKHVTLAFEEHSTHASEKKSDSSPSTSTVIRSHKKQSHPSSQEGSFLRIDPRFRKQMVNEREKRKRKKEILERDGQLSLDPHTEKSQVMSSSHYISAGASPTSSTVEKGQRPLEMTKAWEEAYLTHDMMQEAMRQKKAKIEKVKAEAKHTRPLDHEPPPVDRDVVKRLVGRPRSPMRFMRKKLAPAGRVARRGDPAGSHDHYDGLSLDAMELGPSEEVSLSEWFEMEMIMRDMELQDRHSRVPRRRIQSAQPRRRKVQGNDDSVDWEVVEEEEETGFRIAPYDLTGRGPKG